MFIIFCYINLKSYFECYQQKMSLFSNNSIKKKDDKQKKPSVPYVQLQVSTWVKDSHALYDYEAVDNKFHIQKYELKNSVNIYRHVTTMRTVFQQLQDKKQLAMENIYISSVVLKKQKQTYFVQSADVSGVQPHPIIKAQHPDLFKNSYLVLRDYLSAPNVQGYPLKSGNIVRLGRIQYLVIQIKNQHGIHTLKQTSHLQLNRHIYDVVQNVQGTCKVCLCQQSTQQDPLINPCKCKGSCQFIHVGCLKNWIFSKVRKEIIGVATTYNFSKLQCEICKQLFPKTIRLSNAKEVEMITLEKPEKPYLILESFCDKDIKQQKKQRNLHLICPDEQVPIKLGRGHQCQIRLTDISVSRTHSQIRFQNGEFYVKDLKSKFGTLIKFKQEFELKDRIKLQYGRTCLQFKIITEQKNPQKQQGPEQVPIFYTRAQLRQMGQLSDDEQEY